MFVALFHVKQFKWWFNFAILQKTEKKIDVVLQSKVKQV